MNHITDDNQTNRDAPRPDRAAINRANSQHSTGPRTEAGKQRSSLNATRHALTGQTIVLPSDDLDIYQKRAQEFLTEYQPQGPTEHQLVQTISDTAWRLNRIASLENNLLSLGIAEHEEHIDTDHPQARTALALARAYREQSQVIANLGLHGHRLAGLFQRTIKQLREIQAQRHNLEKEQLKNAVPTAELHDKKPMTRAAGGGDGFVFTSANYITEPVESNGHASLIVNATDPEHGNAARAD